MTEELKVYARKDKLDEDEIYAIYSKRVVVYGEEYDYRSWESESIRIYVKTDGALCLSGSGDGHIYLYPDQLEHLKEALDVALKASQPAASRTEQGGA